MSKVIILSRKFLKGHPKAGTDTDFEDAVLSVIDKTYNDTVHLIQIITDQKPKHHTIRFGRRWKTGDKASLRVWSGKPYASKQRVMAPDVTLRVVDILVDYDQGIIMVDYEKINHQILHLCYLSSGCSDLKMIAANDGLSAQDFLDWFQVGKKKGVHEAQILIWGDVKEY